MNRVLSAVIECNRKLKRVIFGKEGGHSKTGKLGSDNLPFPQSMDAYLWAEEFLLQMKKTPDMANDHGTMLAWFANAIMRGWDTAHNEQAKHIEELREIYDSVVDAPFENNDAYEYMTTQGPRKAWDEEPDMSKEGWERIDWERFDLHEEIRWRRLKARPQSTES